MSQHLTDAIAKRLPTPERGNRVHYDDGVAGFGGFLVSGQPSAGSELGDAIDREVSQARQGRAKIVANRDF